MTQIGRILNVSTTTVNHPLLSQAGHALLVHPQHLAKGRLLHAD